jgi:hypothetical protein
LQLIDLGIKQQRNENVQSAANPFLKTWSISDKAPGSSHFSTAWRSHLWFQFPIAGTGKERVGFRRYAAHLCDLLVTAPAADSPPYMPFMLQVADKGRSPPTRYKKAMVTVLLT